MDADTAGSPDAHICLDWQFCLQMVLPNVLMASELPVRGMGEARDKVDLSVAE